MADGMADIGYWERWARLLALAERLQVKCGIDPGAACRNRTDDLFITSEQMVPLEGAHRAHSERETRGNA